VQVNSQPTLTRATDSGCGWPTRKSSLFCWRIPRRPTWFASIRTKPAGVPGSQEW